MPQPFLILKLPRTGSTTIQMALDSHPLISCVGEFLNHIDPNDSNSMKAAIQKFFQRAKQSTDHVAFGATMNPFKYRLDAATLRELIPDSCQVFCLTRADHLRQAVSTLLVKHNQQAGVKNAWNQPVDYQTSADIDPVKLKNHIQHLGIKSRELIEFANWLKADFYSFTYEEHFADPPASFAKMLHRLGVTDIETMDCFCGTRKLLQDDLRQVILNYDELLKDRDLRRLLR